MYLEHPVLFGGATGNGGFDLISFGSIQNGKLVARQVARKPLVFCTSWRRSLFHLISMVLLRQLLMR
jgi:hypothetical protein